jgi:hypothetical protein
MDLGSYKYILLASDKTLIRLKMSESTNRVWQAVQLTIRHFVWETGLSVRIANHDYIMRSFIICILQQVLFGWSNREEWVGRDIWHVWEKDEAHRGIWLGYLSERDGFGGGTRRWRPLRRSRLKGTIIKKGWSRTGGRQACAGLIWLRIWQVAGACECSNEPSGFD